MKRSIAVLGAGTFGTALANVLAENGHDVRLWARDESHAEAIRTRRENVRYLPGHPIHESVRPMSDLGEAVAGAEICIVSVPSAAVRRVACQAALYLDPRTMVISTAKGIEADGFHLMSEVLREELPSNPIGVLSGPNFAEEIARQQITATVIASDNEAVCRTVQEILQSTYFRVYSSNDMYGVQLAGALKNIYAIAAGFAAALGVGYNTQGMLLTRSLAEMSRFANSLGARPLTFLGLAGVGDLVVTCTSPLSRNYQIGCLVGQGLSLEEAGKKLGRLAEGVNTVRIVKQKADEMGVYMPIVSGLHAILFEGRNVEDVVLEVMTSEQPSDVEFITGN